MTAVINICVTVILLVITFRPYSGELIVEEVTDLTCNGTVKHEKFQQANSTTLCFESNITQYHATNQADETCCPGYERQGAKRCVCPDGWKGNSCSTSIYCDLPQPLYFKMNSEGPSMARSRRPICRPTCLTYEPGSDRSCIKTIKSNDMTHYLIPIESPCNAEAIHWNSFGNGLSTGILICTMFTAGIFMIFRVWRKRKSEKPQAQAKFQSHPQSQPQRQPQRQRPRLPTPTWNNMEINSPIIECPVVMSCNSEPEIDGEYEEIDVRGTPIIKYPLIFPRQSKHQSESGYKNKRTVVDPSTVLRIESKSKPKPKRPKPNSKPNLKSKSKPRKPKPRPNFKSKPKPHTEINISPDPKPYVEPLYDDVLNLTDYY